MTERIHPDAERSLWWNVGYSNALSCEELVGEVPQDHQEAYERGQTVGKIARGTGPCPE